MSSLELHPTVRHFRARPQANEAHGPATPLDAAWLRQLALDAGADDVGFVEIERPELADQRADIESNFPHARTLLSFVVRMNRENVRSPGRSLANLEFHHATDETNEIARRLVRELDTRGVRAMNAAAAGFPMEMDRWVGKVWMVSHKPIAVAAGLGRMGVHRNVIHPKFGNFILLGTVLLDTAVTEYSRPIDYNPCLECKLCVAACPTGAIGADGSFNFSACYTHNYREFMGGFSDWVSNLVESNSMTEYREGFSDAETASMWQSLGFGPNYKAAYCMAVCPAGEDVIGPFLTNRRQFLSDVVRPLQEKVETVYVVGGSDAERYVARRFPHKRLKRVRNGFRTRSIAAFLGGLAIAFQREAAADLAATYHFTFTGAEPAVATIDIRDQRIEVTRELSGTPSIRITVDSDTWLGIVAGERNVLWALVRGKLRVRGGSPRLLRAFARCFPA
jgi:ferredoxin